MVGPEPTGLGGTHPPSTMTMAPAPAVSTTADNSTESGGSSMDDIFEKIRNKFLNEFETIPCKYCLDAHLELVRQVIQGVALNLLETCALF